MVELGAPQRALGPRSSDLTRAVLSRIDEPKLFMAGRSAVEAGYDPSDDAAAMYRAALKPKQLALFANRLPGNALLQGDRRARKTVISFLAANR